MTEWLNETDTFFSYELQTHKCIYTRKLRDPSHIQRLKLNFLPVYQKQNKMKQKTKFQQNKVSNKHCSVHSLSYFSRWQFYPSSFFFLAHLIHIICQEILLVLHLWYIQNLNTSHYISMPSPCSKSPLSLFRMTTMASCFYIYCFHFILNTVVLKKKVSHFMSLSFSEPSQWLPFSAELKWTFFQWLYSVPWFAGPVLLSLWPHLLLC